MFGGDNIGYLEALYERFLNDPSSVDAQWRRFFESDAGEMPAGGGDAPTTTASTLPAGGGGGEDAAKQYGVARLVDQYRMLGAREAAINPLDYTIENLGYFDLRRFGLSDADLDTVFVTDVASCRRAPLRDIIAALKRIYCGACTCEMMHLSANDEREWLLDKFENKPTAPPPRAERIRLLSKLIAAEALEKFLHTKYVGQKRFSLEGGDSLIPLVDAALRHAGDCGVVETVIGMAHRGRLNVLVNILGKRPGDLFMEFEGKLADGDKSGDVKYHMGFSSTLKTAQGTMHLALAFNPSHLEIVNPVVEGSARARQDRRERHGRRDRKAGGTGSSRANVLPLLIHGDAAFAGQGVVMETLNFSQAHGYKTGGTVHIIVNNQIGFTTSSPDDARSTFFCSDIAKMAEIPIIHVNGDDVDDLLYSAKVAMDYRQKFGKDILIDMVCFRRHGHNEQDEPMVTQPLMYEKIARHPGSPAVYAKALTDAGVVTADEVARLRADYLARLEGGEATSDDVIPTQTSQFVDWTNYAAEGKDWDWHPPQKIRAEEIAELGARISRPPASFTPHKVVARLLRARQAMAAGDKPLDWGMAENLSYATLLAAGHNVRLSGQDCGRGTFAHRHAVLHDQKRSQRDGGNYVPLRALGARGDSGEPQGDFLVIDSILSEEAVLGFEYGYATTNPKTLVIWEAQFGDFANGAQVVIDQFISSGEMKWSRLCGLTMLLPHGYEGQGPEHSSARLERYLQLCAEYNMQVCAPSSPAQIYHLLRRQALRPLRRPLVIVSPKSLLRHPEAVSSLADLADGRFAPLIGETDSDVAAAADEVKQVVFCSGKIYYELRAARRERGVRNVAICRLEQLYPFPHAYARDVLGGFPNAAWVIWCQEEPGNQGAWHRIQHYLRRCLREGQRLHYALRPSAASPAVGYAKVHKQQQAEVIDAALTIKSLL